jgi:hypothetical protein
MSLAISLIVADIFGYGLNPTKPTRYLRGVKSMRICFASLNNSNKKLYVHLKTPMKEMRRVGANLGEVIFHEHPIA